LNRQAVILGSAQLELDVEASPKIIKELFSSAFQNGGGQCLKTFNCFLHEI
jgi:hypothetical protein